jgi:hypothetical protein
VERGFAPFERVIGLTTGRWITSGVPIGKERESINRDRRKGFEKVEGKGEKEEVSGVSETVDTHTGFPVK